MQAYVACLKQHGVDLPANGRVFGNRNGQGGQGVSSPPGSFQLGGPPQTQVQTQTGNSGTPASPPPSIDRAKPQAARDACADLLPEGATFGGGFAGRAGGADATAFNAYRSCMSDHGVTIGGGQNGSGGENGSGQTGGAPVSIDRNSDTFKAANAVCAPLLPQGGQGFAGGQGNGGQGGQTGQGGNTQGTTP
jgi:hypothetical protein